MTKTRSLTVIIVICFLVSILFHTLFSFAEQLTFTAYYPSPNAFYNNLNTTNLKVDNNAFVMGGLVVGTPIGDTESDISIVKPTDAATLLLYGASDVTDPNSNYANLILGAPASIGNEDPYMWGIIHSSQVGTEHKLGYVYHGSGNFDTTTTPPTPIFLNVLTMDTDGDVGINTTDPQAALHVAGGNAIFEGDIGIGTTESEARLHVRGNRWPTAIFEGPNANNSGSPVIAFKELGSGPHWIMSKRGSNWSGGQHDNLLFSYCPSVDANGQCTSGTWREHMRFDTNRNVIVGAGGGNVGIGTAAPVSRLHVAGNTTMIGNVGIGVGAEANPANTRFYARTRNYIRLEGESATAGASPAIQFRTQGSASFWQLTKRGSSYTTTTGVDKGDHLTFSYYDSSEADPNLRWKGHMQFDTQKNVKISGNLYPGTLQCRICYQGGGGGWSTGECRGTKSGCTPWGGGWTPWITDDTDESGSMCSYRWRLQCRNTPPS